MCNRGERARYIAPYLRIHFWKLLHSLFILSFAFLARETACPSL
jgi:hypothetical protein